MAVSLQFLARNTEDLSLLSVAALFISFRNFGSPGLNMPQA
jgi:hypothetical protein